jgi:hypothetical protein
MCNPARGQFSLVEVHSFDWLVGGDDVPLGMANDVPLHFH